MDKIKSNSPFTPPVLIGTGDYFGEPTADERNKQDSPDTVSGTERSGSDGPGRKPAAAPKASEKRVSRPQWKNGNVEMLVEQHRRLRIIASEFGIPVKYLTWRAVADFLEHFDSLKSGRENEIAKIRNECPSSRRERATDWENNPECKNSRK